MFQILIFIVNNCYFNSHLIYGALEDFFLVLFISLVNDFFPDFDAIFVNLPCKVLGTSNF